APPERRRPFRNGQRGSMRVPVFLADNHVAFETLYHPPAYTAQRRASHLHVPGRQLVKCVLLRAPAGYLLAVLPADARIDLAALRAPAAPLTCRFALAPRLLSLAPAARAACGRGGPRPLPGHPGSCRR